jgi:3-methyladenine DNA glycosylase AlkD
MGGRMKDVDGILKEMKTYFLKNSSPAMIAKYSRFFREGFDPYGVNLQKLSEQTERWYEAVAQEFNLADYKRLFAGLFKSGKYEDISVVIGFLSRLERYYSPTLFEQIRKWVAAHFTNWAQVDGLCRSVLRQFLLGKIAIHKDLLTWHKHESKWVRRCVPVATVEVFYLKKELKPVLVVAELLINDPVREVGQGVGWMLRDAWKIYPEEIEQVLLKHVKTGNRTAYQYACEKMDKSYRFKFRRPKT